MEGQFSVVIFQILKIIYQTKVNTEKQRKDKTTGSGGLTQERRNKAEERFDVYAFIILSVSEAGTPASGFLQGYACAFVRNQWCVCVR